MHGYMRASKELSRTTSLTTLGLDFSPPVSLPLLGDPLELLFESMAGGSLLLVEYFPAKVIRVIRMAEHLK